MDNKTFVSCIGLLQSIFGQANPELVKHLLGKFKDAPDELFKSACSKIIDTFKPTSQIPFPLPAHFNDAMGLSGNNRAVLAVAAVKSAGSSIGPYSSVSFGDRAIHEAINHFGGWVVVSNWHDEDWKFQERKFIDVYEANLAAGNGPDHLTGLCENDFYLKGSLLPPERKAVFLEKIKPREIIWHGYTKIQITQKSEPVQQQITGEVSSIADIIKSISRNAAEEFREVEENDAML
jgi:hypothetical protein